MVRERVLGAGSITGRVSGTLGGIARGALSPFDAGKGLYAVVFHVIVSYLQAVWTFLPVISRSNLSLFLYYMDVSLTRDVNWPDAAWQCLGTAMLFRRWHFIIKFKILLDLNTNSDTIYAYQMYLHAALTSMWMFSLLVAVSTIHMLNSRSIQVTKYLKW